MDNGIAETTHTLPTHYSLNTRTGSLVPERHIDLMPTMLSERIARYGVILPNFAPVYDRLFVYPLDDADQADKVGSIVLPNQVKAKHGAERGLLLAAGARAHEELYSHGIELGHIVVTAHLSPWVRQYATPKGIARILILRSADIVGSEDVLTAYQAGTLWLQRDASTGEVQVGDRLPMQPIDNNEGV